MLVICVRDLWYLSVLVPWVAHCTVDFQVGIRIPVIYYSCLSDVSSDCAIFLKVPVGGGLSDGGVVRVLFCKHPDCGFESDRQLCFWCLIP